MSERKPLVIFHHRCADGYAGYWCFWRQFGNEYEYVPGTYTTNDFDIELFRDRVVFLVDFSYKRAVVEEIIKVAKSVTIIDHHVSALHDLENTLDLCNCDTKRSGAMLAWDYLNPGADYPIAIKLIGMRDLWDFSDARTKPFSQYLFSLEYDIEEWDKVIRYSEDPETLDFYVSLGTVIEKKHMKDLAEMLKQVTRQINILEWTIPVANLPYTMASDAGNMLSRDEPFAATYYDTEHGRHFSLRSHKDNPYAVDVSKVAFTFGGGGHKHASGFKVPRDHELARI